MNREPTQDVDDLTIRSVDMLRAVVQGRTYDSVAADFGVTRTAVERRVKSVAVQLTQVVGVDGLKYASGQVTLNCHRRPWMLVSTNNCVDTWTLPNPIQA